MATQKTSKAKTTKQVKKTTTKSAASSAAKTKTKAVVPKAAAEKTVLGSVMRWPVHAVLAFVYIIEAGLILFLSATKTLAVTGSFLAKDTLASSAAGKTVYAPASQHMFDINIAWVLVLMLVIAAAVHGIVALRTKQAKQQLEHSKLRWAGLGINGVIIMTLLSMLVGLRDIALLVAVASLTGIVGFAGYMLETRQSVSKRVLYSFAGIAALIPWLIIATAIVMAALYGTLSTVVLWVAIVQAMVMLFLYVGVYNLYAAKRQLKVEVALFMAAVAFVLYSTLAWQVYAGLLRV